MLKRFRVVLSLLLIFGFSAALVGKEGTDAYFPHAIGSYWAGCSAVKSRQIYTNVVKP